MEGGEEMSFEALIRDMAQLVVERARKDMRGNYSAEALEAVLSLGDLSKERDGRGRRKEKMIKSIDDLPVIEAEFVEEDE